MKAARLLLAALIVATLLPYPLALATPAGQAVAIDTPGSDAAYASLTLADGTVAVAGVACDADAFIAFTGPRGKAVYIFGNYSSPPSEIRREKESIAAALAPSPGGVVAVGSYSWRPFIAKATRDGIGKMVVVQAAGKYRVNGGFQAVARVGGGYLAAGHVRLFQREVFEGWKRVGDSILVALFDGNLDLKAAYLLDVKGGGEEQVYSLAQGEDGAVYLAGSTSSGYGDALVVKLTAQGKPEWAVRLSSPRKGVTSDAALSAAPRQGGGVVVTGYYTVSEGYSEVGFVAALKPTGEAEWVKASQPLPLTRITAVTALPGGYAVFLESVDAVHASRANYIVELDAEGRPRGAYRVSVPGLLDYFEARSMSYRGGRLLLVGASHTRVSKTSTGLVAAAVLTAWPPPGNLTYPYRQWTLLKINIQGSGALQGSFAKTPPSISKAEITVKQVDLKLTQVSPPPQKCSAELVITQAETQASAKPPQEGGQKQAPQEGAQQNPGENTGRSRGSNKTTSGGTRQAPGQAAPSEPPQQSHAPSIVVPAAVIAVTGVAITAALILLKKRSTTW